MSDFFNQNWNRRYQQTSQTLRSVVLRWLHAGRQDKQDKDNTRVFSAFRWECPINNDLSPIICDTTQQWFSTWAIRPPRGHRWITERQVSYSNFWVGHRNFSALIKYFKFKSQSKVPVTLHSPQYRRQSYVVLFSPHITWLNVVSVGWHLLLKIHNRRDVVNRGDIRCAHCYRSPRNLRVFTRPQEHTVYNVC